jgi:hypothetical protein
MLTLPIEVKNIRHWIYTQAWELYQLLDKAAQLQIQHPDRLFLPVLICRRFQHNVRTMALDLGFIALETIVQPILPNADIGPAAVIAVRDGLGYDLVRSDEALPTLVDGFRDFVPRYAVYYARRWGRIAPVLAPHFSILRDRSLTPHQRGSAMDNLKQEAAALNGVGGPWLGDTSHYDYDGL